MDAELYSTLLQSLSPVGFKPLPGGRKLYLDTQDLTIIADIEKGRSSSDGTYRDVILGYFRYGARRPVSPAYDYSQVYAHAMGHGSDDAAVAEDGRAVASAAADDRLAGT